MPLLWTAVCFDARFSASERNYANSTVRHVAEGNKSWKPDAHMASIIIRNYARPGQFLKANNENCVYFFGWSLETRNLGVSVEICLRLTAGRQDFFKIPTAGNGYKLRCGNHVIGIMASDLSQSLFYT